MELQIYVEKKVSLLNPMHDRNLGGRFFPLIQKPMFYSILEHDLKVTLKDSLIQDKPEIKGLYN